MMMIIIIIIYKYLGILEPDTIKQLEMKEKIKKNKKATWNQAI